MVEAAPRLRADSISALPMPHSPSLHIPSHQLSAHVQKCNLQLSGSASQKACRLIAVKTLA